MIYSRSKHGESSPDTPAQSSSEPARNQFDDGVPPPRWRLLAAAIVAAVVTASWVGGELSTADTDMAQVRSTQAQGK